MSRRSQVAWLAAYIVTVGVITWGMFTVRNRTLATLEGNKTALAEWQVWRDEAERQSTTGPVQRRVPKSAEPPALVLMRDYFATMLGGAILFSSLLFATVALVVRGIVGGSPSSPSPTSAAEDRNGHYS